MRRVLLGEPLMSPKVTADAIGLPRDGSISTTHLTHLAAVGGSMVTRTASKSAFQKNGRALLTQDLVGEIQRAFLWVFPGSDTASYNSGRL